MIKNSLNDVYDHDEHQDLIKTKFVAAPLWDQLIEWLDKKEIFCSADMRIENGLFKWYPVIKEVEHYEEVRTELKPRDTKINALRDAILHALTLI